MFKKIFALSAAVFAFSIAAYSFSEEDIAAIESAKYGSIFTDESLGERLNRLETDFFGMAQAGSIDERIANLSRINTNIKNGVHFPANGSYYNNSKREGILKRIWNNLSSNSLDSGFDDEFLTGFTPPMVNTLSSSGYLNNLGNSYGRFYNNLPAYCPYNGSDFDASKLLKRRYHNNRMARRLPPPKYAPNAMNIINNPHSAYMPGYPYQHGYGGGVRTQYYTPPNIETKSSIHILRD